ncbi:hypothetical protein M514_12634 [Trichuris suis]|uniref:Uncharacterized protein n=1 Tax=Trichuris suis TaxID=68888 RepID=A0A085MU58_9BILA|nr:hypothetical protein M513_12634 [Trichuris suis]KFD60754.1 hypothetical protein M514_12634 [Trichuris suis]
MELAINRRTFAWLDHLTTRDELRVIYDSPKRTHHWLRSGSAELTEVKPDGHRKKPLHYVWWSVRGIEHWEVPPEGEQ